MFMMKHYHDHYTNNIKNGINNDGLKVISFKQTYIHYEKRFGNKHKENVYYCLGGENEQKAFNRLFGKTFSMNNPSIRSGLSQL